MVLSAGGGGGHQCDGVDRASCSGGGDIDI